MVHAQYSCMYCQRHGECCVCGHMLKQTEPMMGEQVHIGYETHHTAAGGRLHERYRRSLLTRLLGYIGLLGLKAAEQRLDELQEQEMLHGVGAVRIWNMLLERAGASLRVQEAASDVPEGFWTDSAGKIWDLSAVYVDRHGHQWRFTRHRSAIDGVPFIRQVDWAVTPEVDRHDVVEADVGPLIGYEPYKVEENMHTWRDSEGSVWDLRLCWMDADGDHWRYTGKRELDVPVMQCNGDGGLKMNMGRLIDTYGPLEKCDDHSPPQNESEATVSIHDDPASATIWIHDGKAWDLSQTFIDGSGTTWTWSGHRSPNNVPEMKSADGIHSRVSIPAIISARGTLDPVTDDVVTDEGIDRATEVLHRVGHASDDHEAQVDRAAQILNKWRS